MAQAGRRFDSRFRADAVRRALDSDRPITQVAAEIGVDRRTLASWVRTSLADPTVPERQADGVGRDADAGSH